MADDAPTAAGIIPICRPGTKEDQISVLLNLIRYNLNAAAAAFVKSFDVVVKILTLYFAPFKYKLRLAP